MNMKKYSLKTAKYRVNILKNQKQVFFTLRGEKFKKKIRYDKGYLKNLPFTGMFLQ